MYRFKQYHTNDLVWYPLYSIKKHILRISTWLIYYSRLFTSTVGDEGINTTAVVLYIMDAFQRQKMINTRVQTDFI